jgi:hypothetical protein
MSAASIVQGSPAAPRLLRQAVATIPLGVGGAGKIDVPDAAITVNSVVVCWGLGVADATALTFSVDTLVAGTGFTIRANADATANKNVGFAVLRY